MYAVPASSTFDLNAFLAVERQAVEQAIGRVADTLLDDVPAAVAEPMRYALAAGGKRLRPILCVAAYRAAGGDGRGGNGVYGLAVAPELIHAYSLVHDDLPCMDDDELRHGRPTVHRVYGARRALVSGAALIPLACLVLERAGVALDLDARERMRLVQALCAAAGAGGMVGGQLLDLGAEDRQIASGELETIHRSKTGALFAASLRLGALAARARSAVVDALDRYGQAVGLAFQITDDVLDVSSHAAALGKAAGRDQALAKATFPGLLGLDAARRRARAEGDAAVAVLRGAGLLTPALEALARFAVERDR